MVASFSHLLVVLFILSVFLYGLRALLIDLDNWNARRLMRKHERKRNG